jgi:beta-phosphoglucomutase family hydrolase
VGALGLGLQAAIFDMDGVVTRTAGLHAAAWKEAFDELLRRHAPGGQDYRPFDAEQEYRAYVDGKPRLAGVRSFVRARGIALSAEEEDAVAARKDSAFTRLLREHGVRVFDSSLGLIKALRARGLQVAIVTSSRHGRDILEAAGIAPLFDVRLDGIDLERLGLAGKPEPDMFVQAARMLGVSPRRAAVIEDAVAGVQAGRRGGFGLVVGIDRGGHRAALQHGGADVVVEDLEALDAERLDAAFHARQEEIAWRIEQEGYDRAHERQMESLFTIGNGYLGVRGALDSPTPASQCDMFIAGIYDSKCTSLPYSEIEFFAPQRDADPYTELVPLPFPFRVAIAVEGVALDFTGPHGRELRRVLDLRHGVLHIDAVYETPGGRRTTTRTRRCASLHDPHLLLQEIVVTPENHWGAIRIEPALGDGDMTARYPHLQRIEEVSAPDRELVVYGTSASGFRICVVSRVLRKPNAVQRLISVFTNRDVADPRAAALAHSAALRGDAFDSMFAAHGAMWQEFWSRADIRVPGNPAVEQALRFGSYHLRLPAGDDPRVSIGARTLSGRAYEGHVFWDTEIFMLPFFLHVDPARARNLLLYRHGTLPGARERARKLGYRGACFAWESTVTGSDATPSKIVLKSTGKEIPIFTGTQQVHVTADIAYAAWRYWEMTGDEAFLAGPGADLLFDTARFWMSRATPGQGRHHIRGVIGPDEYHHGVDDNAYTNWMARFNLERAAWLASHTGTHTAEAEDWAALAESLYVPGPDGRGIIEQFDGFFALADYPLTGAERFKAPVSRLFDWQKVNRMKIIKQADVLMLPWLFPEAFSDEVVAANYRYYEPMTDHGSSLSPSVHAAIAARIGAREDANRYWEQSLWLDLSDTMENSMLGVHAAAMGGTWQALVFGFLGVRFDAAGPRVEVDAGAARRLPPGWSGVELQLAYRGRVHAVKVESAGDARRQEDES